jgi:two-component system, chemotaxis family, sensor kinase CheA
MSRESEFLARLKETFRGESEAHRTAMLNGLLELEKGGAEGDRRVELTESIFREAHSLKGAARAVDMKGIERLCQAVETIFSSLKQGRGRLGRAAFDLLYRALDMIAELMNAAGPASDEELERILSLLKASLEGAADGPVHPEQRGSVDGASRAGPSRKTSVAMSETVRISATRLGAIFLRAEELLSVKQATARCAANLRELQALLESGRNDRAKAALFTQKLDSMSATAESDSLHAAERIDSLLAEIRTALMMPFSTLLELFPRMVRDLAAEEGKEVTWEVHGEDTQIDRRVLEEIKDPLIHMTRNSVSHGIESPDEREKLGKRRMGTVTLSVGRADNDKVELTLRDDGSGVDIAKVRAAAVARGILLEAEAAALSDHDALELIFLSELSTSPMITDISGRGLGLAIARERIGAIGGLLSVETTPGRGTSFRVQAPLTLATFRGVLVRSRGQAFVIPTVNVDRVLRVSRSMVVSVEDRQSIPIDGQAVSFVSLGDVLEQRNEPEEEAGTESWPAVVLLASGMRVALKVDEVLGEQEVLVKNLGRQLARVRNIGGATVLESGELVPILNPADLLKSVSRPVRSTADGVPGETRETTPRRILVVEDSITSRMLLKSILESAGFLVTTAVDGLEAFTLLCVEEFDCLVSDIDMPRMNGIALCEKVRGLPGTADLPIVLVTSMDSREDRERGIDAGANAYIVKSSFDQGNLVEVIERLT